MSIQPYILRGTKEQIAESVTRMAGEVREAIVFVDEPASTLGESPVAEDVFAEMRQFMVDVDDVDDSREAIYTRLEGERSFSMLICSREWRGRAIRNPALHAVPG